MRHTAVLCILLAACEVQMSADQGAILTCLSDLDCDDGNPCTSGASCLEGACGSAQPVDCPDDETCMVREAAYECATLCPMPTVPIFDILANTETLSFPTGTRTSVTNGDDPVWSDTPTLTFADATGPHRVMANGDGCPTFDHTYELATTYPGPVGSSTERSILASDDRIQAWAYSVVAFEVGEDVDEAWLTQSLALGPAEGTSLDVVTLGRGGRITLSFQRPVQNGPGADFVVFENGFDDVFLELATVEVSTDGTTFERFPVAAHTPEKVGAFGQVHPQTVHGFAGVYPMGHGVGFDLDHLRYTSLVRTGQLDLDRIRFIRIVDVIGDGSQLDSFGRPIHDPYPTKGSAGFDLDAIGVLHEAL